MATTPLRSDAARRRTALLAAAQMVFEEQGVDAPLELIAQSAGVGRATLYRNFPDRVSLLEAVLDEEISHLAGSLDRLDLAVDPFSILDALAEMSANNSALLAYWMSVSPSDEARRSRHARFLRLLENPVKKMLSSSLVRRDFNPEDILLLGAMFGAAQSGWDKKQKQRFLARAKNFLQSAISQTSSGK